MATIAEILAEVKAAVETIATLTTSTYIYPDDMADIPQAAVPVAIVQEQRGINNSTTVIGSGCAVHNWTVEVIIAVSRGATPYPSTNSAAQDVAVGTYEYDLLAALLAADLSDVINTDNIVSGVGWLQWEVANGDHAPMWAVRALLSVAQELNF